MVKYGQAMDWLWSAVIDRCGWSRDHFAIDHSCLRLQVVNKVESCWDRVWLAETEHGFKTKNNFHRQHLSFKYFVSYVLTHIRRYSTCHSLTCTVLYVGNYRLKPNCNLGTLISLYNLLNIWKGNVNGQQAWSTMIVSIQPSNHFILI